MTALELADRLEHGYPSTERKQAAAMLRSQHAEIERLKNDDDHICGHMNEADALRAENEKLREQAYRLWMLLDDVDTADDIAKADDKVYRTLCHKYQANRWNIMDGEAIDAARAALAPKWDVCQK